MAILRLHNRANILPILLIMLLTHVEIHIHHCEYIWIWCPLSVKVVMARQTQMYGYLDRVFLLFCILISLHLYIQMKPFSYFSKFATHFTYFLNQVKVFFFLYPI
jgi:hypothetical protein